MRLLAMKKRWAGAKQCRICGVRVIDTGFLGKWFEPSKKDALCSKCYHKINNKEEG